MHTPPFISEIKTNIIMSFDENHLTFPPKIEREINRYLEQSEDKLNKWQALYQEGLLSLEEIEWLIISQKELINLEALKEAGLSQIKINAIQNSILKIILKSIIIRI